MLKLFIKRHLDRYKPELGGFKNIPLYSTCIAGSMKVCTFSQEKLTVPSQHLGSIGFVV